MRLEVNSHALPIYKKNRIASLLCIFEKTIKRTNSAHTPFLEKSTIHAGLSRNNYSELQMNNQSCLTVEEAILK